MRFPRFDICDGSPLTAAFLEHHSLTPPSLSGETLPHLVASPSASTLAPAEKAARVEPLADGADGDAPHAAPAGAVVAAAAPAAPKADADSAAAAAPGSILAGSATAVMGPAEKTSEGASGGAGIASLEEGAAPEGARAINRKFAAAESDAAAAAVVVAAGVADHGPVADLAVQTDADMAVTGANVVFSGADVAAVIGAAGAGSLDPNKVGSLIEQVLQQATAARQG